MTKEEFEIAGTLARNLSIADGIYAKLDLFDKMADLLLKSGETLSPSIYDNLAKEIVRDYEESQFNKLATDYFGE